jgi:hypothetical protein
MADIKIKINLNGHPILIEWHPIPSYDPKKKYMEEDYLNSKVHLRIREPYRDRAETPAMAASMAITAWIKAYKQDAGKNWLLPPKK